MKNFFEIKTLSESIFDAFNNFEIVKDAVSNVKKGDYCGLKFPRGRFPIYNQEAMELREKLLSGEISANDYDFFNDNRNVIFNFNNLNAFEIIGNNTTFLFDGIIQPFDFKKCENLRLKGITIDWINPLNFVEDTIDKVDNRIDCSTQRFLRTNNDEPNESILKVNLSDGKNASQFKDTYNYVSAIYFYHCKDITVEDITIHSTVGMGIIGNEIENINLYRLYVKPSNASQISTNIDATNFINCRGLINYNTCYFEGIGDSAVNIRGVDLTTSGIKANDYISSTSKTVNLNFENCMIKNTKGNGVILQAGEAIIRNCIFKNCMGAGINLSSEMSIYEPTDIYDITITENRFIDCGNENTKHNEAVAVITTTNTSEHAVRFHKNIKIIGNQILGENKPFLLTGDENILIGGNLIGCKKEIEVKNDEKIIIEDNKYIDYNDVFKINPAVFAVGKEYHIMQPIDKEYTYCVRIDDKIYYDEINGIMRSDCDVHRVIVPMDELNRECKYTVIIRKINDRVHNTPLCSETTIEKTYNFKPIPEDGARAYYVADSHNFVKAVIDAANNFGNIDFLILNGDLQCHSAVKEDYMFAFNIASELTNGELPVVFGRGNHETLGREAEHINDYTPNKNGKTYFTFRIGNIWGMILDCGCDHPDYFSEYSGTMNCSVLREVQIDFIKNIISNADNEYLSNGVSTKLIISHIPFTRHLTGKPQDDIETYDVWQKLIEDNIKPDLMISGHKHKYSYHKDNCKFPLIVASERTKDSFGGTGFIFSKENIYAVNTDCKGNMSEQIIFNIKSEKCC